MHMNFYVVKIKGEANAYSRSAYKNNKSNKIRGFLTIIRKKKRLIQTTSHIFINFIWQLIQIFALSGCWFFFLCRFLEYFNYNILDLTSLITLCLLSKYMHLDGLKHWKNFRTTATSRIHVGFSRTWKLLSIFLATWKHEFCITCERHSFRKKPMVQNIHSEIKKPMLSSFLKKKKNFCQTFYWKSGI